jgi:hypothetical protein
VLQKFNVDVALLDPDWSSAGGDKQTHTVDLDRMQPSLRKMMQLTQTYLSQNIVARVPKEFDLQTLEEFGPYQLESIFIDGSLKFKVAYFLPNRQPIEKSVHLKALHSSQTTSPSTRPL